MKIAATKYSLKFKAYEIYVSGCTQKCPGCHNEELWDYGVGEAYNTNILKWSDESSKMIDRIFILGGEPLDQDPEHMMELLRDAYNTKKELWLWTSYEIDQVPEEVKDLVDVIKVGKYEKDNPNTRDTVSYCGVVLASDNQRIWVKDKSKDGTKIVWYEF